MIFEDLSNAIQIHKPANIKYPPHFHKNIEIFICKDGEFTITCNGVKKIMRRGDAMIAFPNDIHSFDIPAYATTIAINFSPSISPIISSTVNTTQYPNFVHNDKLLFYAEQIVHYNYISKSNYTTIYGLLHTIFGLLTQTPLTRKSIDADIFTEAVKYISSNYTDKLSLKGLAKHVGVSESYLSRIFSHKIDGGFKHYIKTYRIDKAKTLLSTTKLSIYEIMNECGFTNQCTFNRVFKQVTSETPGEYRRNNTIYSDHSV